MKSENNLIEIQPLIDIIALALQSKFISNEPNGVSLLIIGKPETAKTSSIFKFINLDFVSYYDEITQKKLIDEFFPMVQQGMKQTLLIPDMINCIEKQKSTRDQFLNLIKSGIDDTGVMQISTPHKQLYLRSTVEGVKFNIITGITTVNFNMIYKIAKRTGLLSRFIPFSISYPVSKIQKIFELIEGNKPTKKSDIIIPVINQTKEEIKDNPELFKSFEMFAVKLGEHTDSFGIRPLNSFKRLAKANAMLNNRHSVTQKDIDKIVQLSNWINFNFNPI